MRRCCFSAFLFRGGMQMHRVYRVAREKRRGPSPLRRARIGWQQGKERVECRH